MRKFFKRLFCKHQFELVNQEKKYLDNKGILCFVKKNYICNKCNKIKKETLGFD